MSNGLAVHRKDPYGRDYWYNSTCSSGYSFTHDSVLKTLFKIFLEHKRWEHGGREREIWEDYSPQYTLAVPEKLVWW